MIVCYYGSEKKLSEDHYEDVWDWKMEVEPTLESADVDSITAPSKQSG